MTLRDYLDEQEQVNDERFIVDDDQKANWALRKISELQKEVERNTKLAEQEIDKIKQWETTQNKQIGDSILYFEGLLNEYAIKQREIDPEFKSMSLPNGRFGFRKQQPKWEYNDEKVLSYLEQAGMNDLIRTTRVPNKAEIRKIFEVVDDKVINKETGEVVEGIEIEQREEKFNWRIE